MYASITIRKLAPSLKRQLKKRAAAHGRSMEEEAREILRTALADRAPAQRLVESIRKRFAAAGFVELVLPPREPMRAPPDFR